jgi:MFS family permease
MAETANSSASGRIAFIYPDFLRYQIARLFIVIGLEMQSVAVGWQVYELTKRPLALGLVGLAQFLPGIILFLLSGHAADRADRRNLLIYCFAGFAVCSGLLLAVSFSVPNPVNAIYFVLVLIGIVRAFSSPVSRSIVPQLVAEEHFQNAAAWNSTFYQTATLIGPALGGLVYALFRGPCVVYGSAAVSAAAATVLTLYMQPRPATPAREPLSSKTVLAGLRYIFSQKVVLGSVSLDLFAVLFGGAVALLPVYAREILRTGPWGLGLLRSAPAIGAGIMAVVVAHRPLRRRIGAVLLWCVGGFGFFTILFGLSRSLILSMIALLLCGACDSISVIIRSMLVQLATPDEMRGRVNAVEMIFIGASNEFGEFESGVTAQWFGAVPAVVLGGIGSLLVTVLWLYLFPALRDVDRIAGAPEHVAKEA